MRQVSLLTTMLLLVGVLYVRAANCAPPTGVHPIIDAQESLLFGGTKNGKWLDAEKIKSAMRGGETYRLYTATKYLGTAVGGKPQDDPDEHTMPSVGITVPGKIDRDVTVIGVCGNWNALPRVPQRLATSHPIYRDVVREFLTRKGLADANINITQLWRVDLEGDRQDEVLIAATVPWQNDPTMRGKRGDYSVVLMRKIVRGKPETIPIRATYLLHDVNADGLPVVPSYTYTLEAVLDVNGDGVMEVVTGERYYEGGGKHVYQIKGNTVIDTTLDAGDYV